MPATKLKKRSPLIGVPDENLKLIDGLYVHSSPPKVLQVNSRSIKQWLREGNVARLEEILLEGRGHELIKEYSSHPKVSNFLKRVPIYLSRIKELHEAATKGDISTMQKMMKIKTLNTPTKNIFSSKNQAGIGLLHKAVYYGHSNIVEFLVTNFPQSVNDKDKDGKTPLHYCGASKEAEKIWKMLIKAGADEKIADSRGLIPSYYMQRGNEIYFPDDENLFDPLAGVNSSQNDFQIKPSNIRIWIHDKDLEKLQRVIWEGQGGKLLVETSNNIKVKRFLEGVPHLLNIIKDLHLAVITDDFEEFEKNSNYPLPVEILGSKDANGLNPLHKAAGLGRLNIAKNITERNKKLVNSIDHEGRTPLHFAAALSKDDDSLYNLLISSNANPSILDKNGKTPAYYKNNAKEIVKLLKVVPEAPRTSLKLLPSWNWPLLRSNDSLPTTLAPLSPRRVLEENASFNQSNGSENEKVSLEEEKTDEEKKVDEEQKNSTGSLTSLSKISREEKSDGKREPKSHENFNEKSKSFDEPIAKEEFKETDVPFLTENAKRLSVESTEQENQTGDYFEIWTNGNEAESGTVEAKSFKTDDTQKDENVGDDYTTNTANENDLEELHDAEENGEEKENESVAYLNVRTEETEERNANEENLEKTKWEIGVERQRLLDEGLLKVEDEDEENTEHADDVDRMIDEGDVEALATMVLNGEGDKLLGKNSTKAEVQVFLENLPSYLNKITDVHKAVRSGSVKNLQATLDRRRFAVAKEYSDKLGATPLHVAVLLQKLQIIKYLGGRFPETLNFKDNLGRTPLHYAAILPDEGKFFNVLLNLGADRKVRDNAGFTPGYYHDNSDMMTYDTLLEEFDAPAHLARDMLSGQDHVLFGSEDGEYLANALGGPLIRGLSKIAKKKPTNPIAYLADFLYDFLKKNKEEDDCLEKSASEKVLDSTFESPTKSAEEGENDDEIIWTNSVRGQFAIADRDEFGQSVLHFAAARAHGRTGLFQLIQDSSVNLGYRDELYRTARDVATQANIEQNINEIDKFVISLAARGETEKIIELFLEGYDHIADLKDDEGNDILAIATKKNQSKTVDFLKAIPFLEANRERMHEAIRAGNFELFKSIISGSKNGKLAVTGKNYFGRCSLHIAVLCQQKEITEYLAQKFPECLRIGDNLERTPMHYAMGVNEVETLSKILIKCGGIRISKDLKGRQPTYYFINKSEILKLQQEEESG